MLSVADLPELQANLKEASEQEARDLFRLMKTLSVSFEQLALTKVGKTVKRVCKKYPSLTVIGRELIASWNKVVAKAMQRSLAVPSKNDERNGITKVLSKVLQDDKVAAELEAALHSTFEKTSYCQKARSIHFNLKKNATLRQKLLDGEITCIQLAHMTTAEMAP